MLHLERTTVGPQWTFGGGTVLMLRFDHRFSKDIESFRSRSPVLGTCESTSRWAAEELTSEYEESAEVIKLQLPEGRLTVSSEPR